MAVQLKRSEGAVWREECSYRCCSPLHGKDTKKVRRRFKHREKQQLKRSLSHESDS